MARRAALKIVGGYMLAALLYISLSDWLLFSLVSNPELIDDISMVKGWGFVLFTGLTLLYLITRINQNETNRYRALLANHHAVILVVNPENGRLVDASHAAESFYGWSRKELLRKHINDINMLPPERLKAEMDLAQLNKAPLFHFQHRLANGEIRNVDVNSGPIDLDGKNYLLSVIHDVTEQIQAKQQVERINRLYNLLYHCEHAIQEARSPAELYQAICNNALEKGSFSLAWIGLRGRNDEILPVSRAGNDQGYIDGIQASLDPNNPKGKGPTAMAMRSGSPRINNDFFATPGTEPWHDKARSIGIAASVALPFRIGGEYFGSLNLYANEKNFFGAKEMQTLQEITHSISYGLEHISNTVSLETTRDVVENSPVVLFRWRSAPEWPVDYVSSNVSRWGYKPEALLAGEITFAEMTDPADLERVGNEVRQYSADNASEYRQVYRILTAHGESRWVEDYTQVIRDDLNRPLYYQGTLTDITERQEVLRALADSEQRFRLAIEQAPVPIMMHAEDGEVLAISKTWLELTGYSQAELKTIKAWIGLAHGERQVEILAGIKTIYQQSTRVHEGEFEIATRTGSRLVWDFSSVGLGKGSDGRLIVISIATDITARKAVERVLLETEKQQQLILDHSPDLVFVNRGDKVHYINPQGVRLLGASSSRDLLGRSIYDFYDSRLHKSIKRGLAQLRSRAGLSIPSAYQDMLALDGSVIPMQVQAVSYVAEDTLDILVTCRDIREQRKAERTIAEYVAQLENAVYKSVATVSQMVELRDPYTAGHERRVGELAGAIAREMGLDENTQRGLRIAGAVHDVGKIMVPTEILAKPGKLSDVEYELIKGHAENGYQVLKDIDFPWPVALVARQHHERLDGSGYPNGLQGDAIIPEARILAVADVVESMSSHRPYRAAIGIEIALAEIEAGAGKHYDPEAVQACLRLFREQQYQIPE